MTTHYNIEITATQTHLKVTYRDGKFRKLEHLRGVISKDMLKNIGRIIPPKESDFSAFVKEFTNRVSYTRITQEKSLYSQFLSEWAIFYENFTQLPPKFTGADGAALKGIIGYLKKVSTNENEALELWKVLLSQWDTLNDFHKANTDLKYFNSKLNIILNGIFRQNNTYT